MQAQRYLAFAFVSLVTPSFGCATSPAPNSIEGGPDTNAAGRADASPSGAGPGAGAGGTAPPSGGMSSTASPPAPDVDAASGVVDAGAASAVDGSSSRASGDATGPAAEGGDDGATETIPTPVTVPYVWGVGIGITDVPSAVKFYTQVMQMTVEQSNVQRDDRTETVLYATQANRGSRLVLMNFNDKRNTEDVTAKLVWQASNPTGVSTAAASFPGYVSRLAGGVIVQFDGPETYIQEVGSGFDTGGTGITVPYIIALGMSVSNQPTTRQFYMTAFGMTEALTGTFQVTDATGTGTITEYTEQYSTQGGAAIVLQAWTPQRNSKNNPVKVVLFVPDAQSAADKVAMAGGTIVKPAERTPVYGNRKLIVAQDPDGYIIELVE